MNSLSEIIPNSSVSRKGSSTLPTLHSALPNIRRLQSRWATFADFSRKFSPGVWKDGIGKGVTRWVECSAPTLKDVDLAYGVGNGVAWLMVQLEVFNLSANVPHKMSPLEIEVCAQTIAESYFHLKTTEVMLFFSRLLGGMYPVDWHGHITPDKVVGALRDHFMPWRNDLLCKIDRRKLDEERGAGQEDKMSREEWEEIKAITAMYNAEYTVTYK